MESTFTAVLTIDEDGRENLWLDYTDLHWDTKRGRWMSEKGSPMSLPDRIWNNFELIWSPKDAVHPGCCYRLTVRRKRSTQEQAENELSRIRKTVSEIYSHIAGDDVKSGNVAYALSLLEQEMQDEENNLKETLQKLREQKREEEDIP